MPKKRRHKMGIERPPETPPPPPSFFDPYGGLPRDPSSGAPPPSGEQPPAAGAGGYFWEQMFGQPVPVGRGAAKTTTPQMPTQPGFIRPSVDVGKYFDLNALFEHIKSVKKSPTWKPPTTAPLVSLAEPTTDDFLRSIHVGRFFNLPDGEINRYGANAWRYMILPFIQKVEQALNLKKPADLPGSFKFDFASDGSFGLGYIEQQ